MKRFEDVLRVLSSILLGSLIRDFDSLDKHLKTYLESHGTGTYLNEPGMVATAVSFVLILTLLRNIHGSARYDDYVEDVKYKPSFETRLRGRVGSFILAIAALFASPIVGHHIAHHLNPSYSQPVVAILLFFPFLIYSCWDILLCFADPEAPNGSRQRSIREVAVTWLKIDMIGVVGVMLIGLWALYLRGCGQDLPTDFLGLGFTGLATVMIGADYLLNAHFYFPARS
jgi:hypothetical protein